MTIKAICFDADGVVVNPQMQFSSHLREKYGISPEMTRAFFRGVFNDCLIGKANLEDVLPAFLKEWGWKASLGEFIDTWLFRDHVIDMHLMNTIQRLHQNGMICCLATSQRELRTIFLYEGRWSDGSLRGDFLVVLLTIRLEINGNARLRGFASCTDVIFAVLQEFAHKIQ